ncbi:response regulator transcription factor [Arthrobacter rhombi]|uniref:response regulator transcription factor n=1 Tax=Arthrobacter rhombi TaxID=71253 RepID=UPI003FD07735
MQEHRVAVVVEDDEDIRGLLEAVLSQSGFVVHATALGNDGVELVKRNAPDLVTLDLGLPDIDGFEVARRIRHSSDAHIVMLTARTDEIDTILGLETGADDFLTKPFSPRELRARVEAIMRRRERHRVYGETSATTGAPAAPAVAEPLSGQQVAAREPETSTTSVGLNGLVLDSASYCIEAEGTEIAVTPTEFALLQAILVGGRTVRTKTSLVRRLRDEDADAGTFVSEADERSVEVHIGNLRRKLADNAKAPRWIETVRGIGYRAARPRQSAGGA